MEKRNSATEFIALSGVVTLICSIVYIRAYSSNIGFEVATYFTITDYFNIAPKAFIQMVMGLMLGLSIHIIKKKVIESNEVVTKLWPALIMLLTLLILFIVSVLTSKIELLSFIFAIVAYVISFKHIDKYLEKINLKWVIYIIIMSLTISYIFGISSSINDRKKVKNPDELNVVNITSKEVTGYIFFSLSDYILLMEHETEEFILINKDKVITVNGYQNTNINKAD